MQSIFRELKIAKQKPNLSDERLGVLIEIEQFIFDGRWTTKRKCSQRVLEVVKYGSKEAAKRQSISNSGIRLLVARSSNAIRKLIGSNTIKMITDGSEEEFRAAALQFSIIQYGTSPLRFIQPGVIEVIPDKKPDSYSVEELTAEIEFLCRHTSRQFSRELEGIDLDKLGFVVREFSAENADISPLRVSLFNRVFGDSNKDFEKGEIVYA